MRAVSRTFTTWEAWPSAWSSARVLPGPRSMKGGRLWPAVAERGHDEVPDVLIVGAGASGAVAAKRLAEEGFDVVVLEQGNWPDYKRARAPYPDYELTSRRNWACDPNTRRAPADYPVADTDSDITALMLNGVGASHVGRA